MTFGAHLRNDFFTRLEFAMGQFLSKCLQPISSALGGEADMLDLFYGCPIRLFLGTTGRCRFIGTCKSKLDQ